MNSRGNVFLKRMDGIIGIPLVYLMGLLRLRRRWKGMAALKQSSPRILFIKTEAVGDTVLLSAMAAEVKKNLSRSHLTLLVSSGNKGVTPLLTDVDRTLVCDFLGPLRVLRFVWMLCCLPVFDLLVDFGAWPRIDALLSAFARARFKIGFSRKNMFRHYAYDRVVPHRDFLHEIDNYRNLLKALGMQIDGLLPSLRCSRSTDISRFVSAAVLPPIHKEYEHPKSFIVCHPFASGEKHSFKEWPVWMWGQTIKNLYEQHPEYGFALTGGPMEKHRALLLIEKMELSKQIRSHLICLAGRFDWQQTAWFLQERTALLITVNTGVMHVAAALRTPLISLNGPTDIHRWGALQQQKKRHQKEWVQQLKAACSCSPCLSLGFEYRCKVGGCMQTLLPNEVIATARKVLAPQ